MKKRKILIIGVGGIGSYLAPILSKTEQYDIVICDPDKVESHNLYYQNFQEKSVGLEKVNALEGSYKERRKYPVLTDKQIEGGNRTFTPELVICCADNLDVRALLYRQGFQDNCGIPWLDLRAQGRNGAMISFLTDPKFSDTFLAGPEGSFSCQGEVFNETRDTQHLHFTHITMAGIGAQWIQRWFMGEIVKDKMVINI